MKDKPMCAGYPLCDCDEEKEKEIRDDEREKTIKKLKMNLFKKMFRSEGLPFSDRGSFTITYVKWKEFWEQAVLELK